MMKNEWSFCSHVAKIQLTTCSLFYQSLSVLRANMPPVDFFNLTVTYVPDLVVVGNISYNSTWPQDKWRNVGMKLTPLALNFLAVGVVASLTVICGGIYAYIRYLDKRKTYKFRGERAAYLKQCRPSRLPPRKSVRRKTRTKYAMAIKMKPRR